MRVAVVAPSGVPFVFGGAERFWWDLCRALQRETAHEVELLKVVAPERTFWEVVASYEAFFRLDLSHFDLVVATKYPAWMVGHPNKVVYLQHPLRGLYETYPEGLPLEVAWPAGEEWQAVRAVLAGEPTREAAAELFAALARLRAAVGEGHEAFRLPSPLLRACVRFWDRVGLARGEVRRYGAISERVRTRPGYFPPEAAVWVAPHPSGLRVVPRVHHGRREVVFVAASRWDRPKRLDWVVEAFRGVAGAAELRLVGWGPEEGRLRALAAGDERIRFLGRLSDAALAEAYAEADVAVFVPFDEDMGLVTLEAMGAGCPVVTTADSGGVREFVRDGVNGWVCAPSVAALRERLAAVVADPEGARALAVGAVATAGEVRWGRVFAALGLAERPPGELVVVSPFPLRPPLSGGPRRVWSLYRGLSAFVPVRVVCFGGEAGRRVVEGQFVVEELGTPEGFAALAKEWSQKLGVSAGDWALWAHGELWQEVRWQVAGRLSGARAVVLTHPYGAVLLPGAWQGPVIYDAHNVEWALKQGMWRGEEAEEALAWLSAAEYGVVRRAAEVWCVSEEDRETFARHWPELVAGRSWRCVPNGWAPEERAFLLAGEKVALRARAGVSEPERPAGVFVGSWHEPNVEAALWWLREAVPQLPGWHHWLVGGVCHHPEVAAAAAAHGVVAWGVVDEAQLRGLLAAADVGWNPMVLGSGSNLKVLDYVGSGAVVVSTPFGLRGFEFLQEPGVAVVAAREELPQLLRGWDSAAWDEARVRAREGAMRFSWRVVADGAWAGLQRLWFAEAQ